MLNSSNKYELRIKFQVLKKIKELPISLEPKSESKEEIIQHLLNKVINQKNRIELLEKEVKGLLDQKNKQEKPLKEKDIEKEKNEENIQNIDITKVKIQRKKDLFQSDLIKGISVLDDGRIAMSVKKSGIFETRIVIIDSDSLEIMFIIEIDAYDFIELKKDILAVINKGFSKNSKISIIKLEEKKYHLIQEIEHELSFSELIKLTDGTLLALAVENEFNEEMIFYKEKDNSYFQDYSIDNRGNSKYIFKLTNNEIVYIFTRIGHEIIVYDYVNKLKNINFDIRGKYNIFLGTDYKAELISDDLLFILKGKKQCFIFNFREETMVDSFKSDKRINHILSIKGKYFFIMKEDCIMQLKVENNNLNLIFELKLTDNFCGLIYLKKNNGKKFVSYDEKGNVYELY